MSCDKRVIVEEMEEADNRDAARSGTQTDRNYTGNVLETAGLKNIVKTTFLKLVWSLDSVSDILK